MGFNSQVLWRYYNGTVRMVNWSSEVSGIRMVNEWSPEGDTMSVGYSPPSLWGMQFKRRKSKVQGFKGPPSTMDTEATRGGGQEAR